MTTRTTDRRKGNAFELTREELMSVYDLKYRRSGEAGWGPKMRLDFNYFSPDDYYEALVAKLVTPGCCWIDIGCGRDIFPQHRDLARELSSRSGYLLGIDPDDNVRENPFVTEYFQGLVEDCDTTRTFDLVTLRMVAEHIVEPDRAVGRIAALLKSGGLAVFYTPNKWAPMSLIAAAIPFRWHNPLKRLIWDTEERDTFPTAYKLNTRKALAHYGGKHGLEEIYFRYLDDCRVTSRFRRLNRVELSLRKMLRKMRLRYPENCLLGVYRKAPP